MCKKKLETMELFILFSVKNSCDYFVWLLKLDFNMNCMTVDIAYDILVNDDNDVLN